MWRDIFSGVKIHHLWGIEDESQKSSITWSCKHVLIRDAAGTEINIVVDFWMHQWWKSDNDFNTQIDEKVISADYIFVTHAHLDHIGRLPMLVSRGFKGKIIMTPATKALAQASLLDSANIMKLNYDAKIEDRKRKWKILSDVSRYTSLQKNEKRTQADNTKMREIEWEYWSEKIQNLQAMLEKVHWNIVELLPDVVKPLYSEDEVNVLFWVSTHPSSRMRKWTKWKNRKGLLLPDEIQLLQDNAHLFHDGVIPKDISWHENNNWTSQQWSQTMIETYRFWEKIPLASHKSGRRLDGSSLKIQDIVAQFLPAGHILGSAQLEVQIWVERILKWEQVDIAYLKKEQDRYTLFFGGDIWRFDAGNNIGAPSLPSHEYLYREMEGTYAGKNHPEREEAFARLYSILQSAGKHILLPNFSIQRTPDMLLLLLDYVEQICIPRSNELKKRNKELKWYLIKSQEILKDTNDQDFIRELEAEKKEYEQEFKKNEEEIDRMDIVIISDSALAQKILPTYISEYPEIYGWLTEQAQKERFWGKVIIKYVSQQESRDYFARYMPWAEVPAQDRRTKIIVSSAGMCEGGPVIGHLQRMVWNPNYDIIFTGYAPPTSLAWKLKWEDPQVIIEGVIYDVHARIHDITWFSWHTGEHELIEWHSAGKMVKGWVDAIVHGWDARFKLATKLNKSHKTAGVICPNLGEMIEIPFPIWKVRNRIVRK